MCVIWMLFVAERQRYPRDVYGVVHVRVGKQKKQREVPLHHSTIRALRTRAVDRPFGGMFTCPSTTIPLRRRGPRLRRRGSRRRDGPIAAQRGGVPAVSNECP